METWPSLSPSERSGALGMLQADSARYNVARTLEVAHSAVSKLMADAGWPYLTAAVLDHDVERQQLCEQTDSCLNLVYEHGYHQPRISDLTKNATGVRVSYQNHYRTVCTPVNDALCVQ